MSSTACAWRSRQVEGRLLQTRARRLGGRRGANGGDDGVELVDRLEQALEDVRALARLLEVELAAAPDHLAAVVDVGLERRLEANRARLAVDEREHVDGERRLHAGVLVQGVEHGAGLAAAAQLDDDAHARGGRTRRAGR